MGKTKIRDLSGMRFGRLKVIDRSFPNSKGGKTMWNCICDCGKRLVVVGGNLTSGQTNSCGCYKRDRITERFTTHSGSHVGRKERLYVVWVDMKSRCYNHNNKSYKNYGGRGISVCDEWATDYGAFRQWAFQNGYNPNAKYGECTIDRVDVNANYSPQNCRFVDIKTQCQNRRNSVVVTINGEKKSTSDIAKVTGFNRKTIYNKIKRGYSKEQIYKTKETINE